jgi:hypothetical protein
MDTCSVETGLLRKKPCGHPAVTHCVNCEQPLCKDHSVPQLTEAGHRSGKFICHECVAALKASAKSMAAAARAQQGRKDAEIYKATLEAAKAPPPAKKPAAPAPGAAEPASAAKPESPSTLEFTPSQKPK